MTDGPRRLNRSGGISQRLLDSASLDKPSHTSRRLAENLASTASAFWSSMSAHAPSHLTASPAAMGVALTTKAR